MSWIVAGTAAVSLISGMQQAEIIRENAKISKAVNEMNAESAELDAYKAEQDGMTKEARYQTTIDTAVSDSKVIYAAADVDASFGTAADRIADTKLAGFLNAADIRNQAHMKAMGYIEQARSFRLAGALGETQAKLNASATEGAAVMGAGKTLVSGYTKSAPRSESSTAAHNGYSGYGGTAEP